jgi:hypothetical protein
MINIRLCRFKNKVGFSFCFDVSAPRNAEQTFFINEPGKPEQTHAVTFF